MFVVYSQENGSVEGISQSGIESNCLPVSKELGLALLENPSLAHAYVVIWDYVSQSFALVERQTTANFSSLRALCPYAEKQPEQGTLYAKVILTQTSAKLESSVLDYQRKPLVVAVVDYHDPFNVVAHLSLTEGVLVPQDFGNVVEHLSVFGPFEYDRVSYCYETRSV